MTEQDKDVKVPACGQSGSTAMLGGSTAETDAHNLLRRASAQIMAWAEKYGSSDADFLPPAGDVQLLEAISAELQTPRCTVQEAIGLILSGSATTVAVDGGELDRLYQAARESRKQ